MSNEYLTELRLGSILNEYSQHKFIHNKFVPNSNLKRFRPDYRCDELSVIIEFDGYAHYCNSKQIVNGPHKRFRIY